MGHNSVVSGHLKSIGILRVEGLSMRSPDLGCHGFKKFIIYEKYFNTSLKE